MWLCRHCEAWVCVCVCVWTSCVLSRLELEHSVLCNYNFINRCIVCVCAGLSVHLLESFCLNSSTKLILLRVCVILCVFSLCICILTWVCVFESINVCVCVSAWFNKHWTRVSVFDECVFVVFCYLQFCFSVLRWYLSMHQLQFNQKNVCFNYSIVSFFFLFLMCVMYVSVCACSVFY